MVHRIGAVQIDTISVLARSHELVAYARLGPVGRDRIERAYWHPRRAAAFEYWSHAACILPIEEWPYYAFRRRSFLARGLRWHDVPEQACKEVLARLRADGPLTATQLGGAKAGGPWWDWSEIKIAAEWLLDIGDVVCVRRSLSGLSPRNWPALSPPTRSVCGTWWPLPAARSASSHAPI